MNDRYCTLRRGLILLGALALVGCDRSGEDKVPQPNPDFDPVVEIGQLEVITSGQLAQIPAIGGHEWCDESGDVARETVGDRSQDPDVPLCHYGQVGLTEIGETGGASFTFKGTGGDVCLIVDPETVFWSAAISEQANSRDNYSYPDVEEDDGDLDLFAGLSAYYTGSPGLEIGDFKGFYTDSLGNEIAIEYGLCKQAGSQTGDNDSHAGRATPEFCTIDTENFADVEFTVVLETFSVPIDDGVLSFGVVVLDGSCSAITECTLQGESLDANDDNTTRSCTPQLEQAYCGQDTLLPFCCLHPEMCGEDADLDDCDAALEQYEADNLEDLAASYCSATNLCCDSE